LYKNSNVEDLADKDFDNLSGLGLLHIKASTICSDLHLLRKKTKPCEDFSDKRIAHTDKKAPKSIPTFNELNDAIDTLDKLYVRYHLMFHAVDMKTTLPIRQYDWKEVFRHPWIEDKK